MFEQIVNNEWEKLSMTKLIGEEYKFAKKDFFNYHLCEDKLCLSIGESKKVMVIHYNHSHL